MRKKAIFMLPLLAVSLLMAGSAWPVSAYAAPQVQQDEQPRIEVMVNGALLQEQDLQEASSKPSEMHIYEVGKSMQMTINAANMTGSEITLTTTSGFDVTPKVINASQAQNVDVLVTLTSTLNRTEGFVILRCGDIRKYVKVVGYGELPLKSLAENPVYAVAAGEDADDEKKFSGFAPSANGYTVEMRVKTDNVNKFFYPFAVTKEGAGFKGYVSAAGTGLYNSFGDYTSEKSISNPATSATGGSGQFYNNDGQFHTYRYAVTSDKRVFVYRDGLAIDTVRVADLAMQPEFAVADGKYVANLLRNPGFEGEWNRRKSDNLVTRIEGWNVYPIDQYNSTQEVIAQELDNAQDFNNHALKMNRYMWSDGWSAGQVSQIVDVSANEVYDFKCLAKGGIWKDNAPNGSIRMYDLQNADNKITVPVTSDEFQEYTASLTTKANTKQIKVEFYIERAKWGASVSAFVIDNTVLNGRARTLDQTIGFSNQFSNVAYFTYDQTGAYAPLVPAMTPSAEQLTFDGVNAEQTLTLNIANLANDVTLSATSGFEVSPATIPAGSGSVDVKVTLKSTLNTTNGKLILRSGDLRQEVALVGHDALPLKAISANPVYKVAAGEDADDEKKFSGFAPSASGYTVEMRIKTDNVNKFFYPFAVTKEGAGFKGYVSAAGTGMYNSFGDYTSEKGISNPATSTTGGSGAFYNNDGQFHTYRYAVTSDQRVFVYRDGLAIDTVRVADLALQPEFAVADGKYVANLLKNPGFEGEWNRRTSDNLVTRIEGWNVYPIDQYNSTQEVIAQQIDNTQDFNNHALKMNRYMWSDGWSAGQISQIVDVSANEVYDFKCLAKGGIWKDNAPNGSIRMYDLQNADNKITVPVTSDEFQEYTASLTTKANTKQIKVEFYIERAKWGASVSAFVIDNTVLNGRARTLDQTIGFSNQFSNVDYFTYDQTGAFAPLVPAMTPSAEQLTFNGVNAEQTFTLNAANLANDITLSATSGFEVSPATIPANSTSVDVKVTLKSTLNTTTGKLILRSGDLRQEVALVGHDALPLKAISANPVYKVAAGEDADDEKKFSGFAPSASGYTVEMRIKTDNVNKFFYPFAVTKAGAGFKGYVSAAGTGLYNSFGDYTSQKAISNPATSASGGSGQFYNNDGQFHTYRYAVTSDQRVFVYRDGLAIDTVRVADLAMQPEFAVADGKYVANLLKNPGFEGEWNRRKSDNLVTRIEGWNVYPIDQYNSTQEVIAQQLDNAQDFNNHALKMNRYMWSDGWSAGQVSQIVDVSANEVYDFKCLAKGGIWKDNAPNGSIRMYDLQNADNKITVPVTSDEFQEYTASLTTKANTKQIKVEFYIERAKWGASVSAFVIDNTVLNGRARTLDQTIGFSNQFSNVDYFTYDQTGAYAPLVPTLAVSSERMKINGTGATESFTINAENLPNETIYLSATSGFEVSPAKLTGATLKDAQVNVTLRSTLNTAKGKIIMRSGDFYRYVNLTGIGTPLEAKDLSTNPVYTVAAGEDADDEKNFTDFTPTASGYTVEMRVKTDNVNKFFYPYAVTKEGAGFKGYVDAAGMGLYNSFGDYTSQKALSNPATAEAGGLSRFYNNDGQYHTYRYSVTSDQRVFVYRDGLSIDTVRVADLALQPEFATGDGKYVANLLKNPGFEGEYNRSGEPGDSTTLIRRIEGWNVYPLDQYNSTQEIIPLQISNDQDFNNHALKMNRYMWSDGWSAGQISQIVNVSPNEVYDFKCLAKGGIWKDNAPNGSIRMYDLQNADNKITVPVTSDEFQEYTGSLTTKANTKQIKVEFYIERAKWGASVSAFVIDDAVLNGRARTLVQKVGFSNQFSNVDYFTYDATGAYAPSFVNLKVDDIRYLTGIDEEKADPNELTGYVTNGQLYLSNVTEGSAVRIYTKDGVSVYMTRNFTPGMSIALPGSGMYICIVSGVNGEQTVKLEY